MIRRTCSWKRCTRRARLRIICRGYPKYHWRCTSCENPSGRYKSRCVCSRHWEIIENVIGNAWFDCMDAIGFDTRRARVRARLAAVTETKIILELLNMRHNKQDTKIVKKKKSAGGRRRAKSDGASMADHWSRLFRYNERAPKRNRLTDARIQRRMRSEFPESNAKALTEPGGVTRVRWQYNNGELGPGLGGISGPHSDQYDEHGNVLPNRGRGGARKKSAFSPPGIGTRRPGVRVRVVSKGK